MSDRNERSGASGGSVGEPLAFAVMRPDSYVVVHTRLAATVMRDACGGGEIVPLYRKFQPTLTDAEREALDIARTVLCCTHDERRAKHAATLRGLLERTGGAR